MKKILKKNSYAILLLVVSGLIAGIGSYLTKPASTDTYMTVTIQEGDSLWKVAGEIAEANSMDRKEIINWVKKNNEIDVANIYPGDEIIVPVKKFGEGDGTELASAGGDR